MKHTVCIKMLFLEYIIKWTNRKQCLTNGLYNISMCFDSELIIN